MQKTSVYLPAPLKAALAALATQESRSEAVLIRAAIEGLVGAADSGITKGSQNAQRQTIADRFGSGPLLIGIGVGPGDAELLTVRALRTLRKVDRIFAPCTSIDAIGRAETIVRDAVPGAMIERLVFVMEVNTAARERAIEVAVERISSALQAGERCAFITLGDPNIYSTFSSVAEGLRRIRPDATIASIPGIMAFQELAARTSTVIVDGNEQLHLVPLHAGMNGLGEVLDQGQALVLYKGGRHVPELCDALRSADRLRGAMLGELLGMPGEQIVELSTLAGPSSCGARPQPSSYLATVIVPPRRVTPVATPAKSRRGKTTR